MPRDWYHAYRTLVVTPLNEIVGVVDLQVLNGKGEQVALECTPCYSLPNGEYRLAVSPTMVQGAARGDVVKVLDVALGTFEVIQRGGFLAVNVFGEGSISGQMPRFQNVVASMNGFVESYDERETNGSTSSVMTLSLPVSAGFERVRQAMDSLVTSVPGTRWYYSNAYKVDDGVTPLNWWHQP